MSSNPFEFPFTKRDEDYYLKAVSKMEKNPDGTLKVNPLLNSNVHDFEKRAIVLDMTYATSLNNFPKERASIHFIFPAQVALALADRLQRLALEVLDLPQSQNPEKK